MIVLRITENCLELLIDCDCGLISLHPLPPYTVSITSFLHLECMITFETTVVTSNYQSIVPIFMEYL